MPADVQRLRTLVARAGLPTDAPALGFDRWMALMGRDKKVVAGTIRYVLLDALGRASIDSAVPDDVAARRASASENGDPSGSPSLPLPSAGSCASAPAAGADAGTRPPVTDR